jgi:rare lipoprotein A
MMGLLTATTASGCAAPPAAEPSALPVAMAGGSPQEGPGQRGEAAHYHRRHVGRRMANGQPFRAESDSAAHRTLPFGTAVRVTNLRNGASTTVVIRDRGPFTPGRIIDLSPRSAREIGMHGGVAPVLLVPLGPAP